ncbi:hypothetical protein AC578_2486 [Pseudocercospora eumusae]|uniref:Uncharacterized protein n=1 Tax=Pseudocercospora eumusae TaxID=321146 RepID=A0A139HXQ9_9PEZI|nr:hypothetical protein AC578_2486 [Pseudocercospora eumusae]
MSVWYPSSLYLHLSASNHGRLTRYSSRVRGHRRGVSQVSTEPERKALRCSLLTRQQWQSRPIPDARLLVPKRCQRQFNPAERKRRLMAALWYNGKRFFGHRSPWQRAEIFHVSYRLAGQTQYHAVSTLLDLLSAGVQKDGYFAGRVELYRSGIIVFGSSCENNEMLLG